MYSDLITIWSLQNVFLQAIKLKIPTIFEERLKQLGIRHKLIRPLTSRHSSKVERSHRKDNERFYATHTFYSFDNFKKE